MFVLAMGPTATATTIVAESLEHVCCCSGYYCYCYYYWLQFLKHIFLELGPTDTTTTIVAAVS